MRTKGKECTFCQLVDYLARQGMIDEYDRVIIAHHMQQEHGPQTRDIQR